MANDNLAKNQHFFEEFRSVSEPWIIEKVKNLTQRWILYGFERIYPSTNQKTIISKLADTTFLSKSITKKPKLFLVQYTMECFTSIHLCVGIWIKCQTQFLTKANFFGTSDYIFPLEVTSQCRYLCPQILHNQPNTSFETFVAFIMH